MTKLTALLCAVLLVGPAFAQDAPNTTPPRTNSDKGNTLTHKHHKHKKHKPATSPNHLPPNTTPPKSQSDKANTTP